VLRVFELAAAAEALVAPYRERLVMTYRNGVLFTTCALSSTVTIQLSQIAEAMVTGFSDLAPELSFRDGLWRLTFSRPIRAEWRGLIACVLRQAEQFALNTRVHVLDLAQ
jgi:hypothetical protein